MSKNDYEEYCEECEYNIDECECDDGPSFSEVLDGLNKGLDVVKKLKDLTTPPQLQRKSGVGIGAMLAAQNLEHQMAAEKAVKERQEREKFTEEQEHRKWKIDLAIKIGVPITVAIIAGLVYLASI